MPAIATSRPMTRWHREYRRLSREISLIVRKSPQLRLVRLGDAPGTGKVRYPFYDETNGFYIYEVRRGRGPLYGADIVRAVTGRCPVDRRPSIDSRINHSGVLRPSNWGRRKTGWSQSIYFYRMGARHCHIHEVPAGLPEQDRVNLHLLALETLLGRLASTGSVCGLLSSSEVCP